MYYIIPLIFGFIGGLGGALFLERRRPKVVPSPPQAQVVRKKGPSIYVVEKRRKPKVKSEHEIWEEENGQNLHDRPLIPDQGNTREARFEEE